jgi:hypothetical protein
MLSSLSTLWLQGVGVGDMHNQVKTTAVAAVRAVI